MEPAPGLRILTAFEPFGKRRRNLSHQVLESFSDPRVERHVLPVVFDALAERIETLVARKPNALVLMGETRRRRTIDVERIALNVLDASKRPDNSGQEPFERPIVPGGPLALAATWDADRVVEALGAAGLDAKKSYHAGCYACNQALYLALHASLPLEPRPAIGFLHLPARREDLLGWRATRLARTLSAVLFDSLAGVVL